jgi:hypothetical protein
VIQSGAEEEINMFCTQCDTQRARNQKICINCGSFLEAATPAVRGTYTGHRKEINSLLLSGGLVAVMAIVLIPLFSYLRTQPQAASNAKIDKAPPATTQSDFVVGTTPVDDLQSPPSVSLAKISVLLASSGEPRTPEIRKVVSPGLTKTASVTSSQIAPNISSTSFRVGAQPTGMLFDGNYVWISNNSSNSVTKLQPDDGTVLGTFSTGSYPVGLAFDGVNIWVADFGFNGAGNTATVLSARTGRPVPFSPVPVGQGPRGLAFDGANIWAADSAGGTVTKVRASGGMLLGTYKVGPGPECVAFDGENIWVTNRDDSSLSKIRASDGKLMGMFTVGSGPFGITFAAGHIWVANADSNVTELNLDGSILRTAAVGNGASWVTFDGANIWVASQNSHTVTEVRASDGKVLGMFPLSGNPWGVAFDGANIWVSNFMGGNVWKLYSEQTGGAQAAWLGFANGNAAQDRDPELRRNCGNFNRVEVPYNVGNDFKNLCGYVNKTCEKVCDWEGHILSCDSVSMGGRRDGTRLALCRQ